SFRTALCRRRRATLRRHRTRARSVNPCTTGDTPIIDHQRGARVRVPVRTMSKAFSQEETTFEEDEAPDEPSPLPVGARNYMTPGGFARLKGELDRLTAHERPELVATVAWAASNGDRSENADYI